MNKLSTTLYLVRISTLALLLNLHPANAQTRLANDPVETELLKLHEKIQQQDWPSAEKMAKALKRHYPNFKLSNLILEAIQQQKNLPQQKPIPIAPEIDEFSAENLLAEYYLRTHSNTSLKNQGAEQNVIIKLAADIQHAVLVDVNVSRLYLLENANGKLTVIADYYIGIGKQGIYKQVRGDHRTPLGVYTIIEYLPDDKLLELYGTGAFPIDYPNTWDKRLGHTGSGIWLHGVPRSTYSRGPRSSRGCITISNALFEQIRPYIEINKTPIVISEHVQRATDETQNTIESHLQAWLNDWQSLQTEAYLSHYHPDFEYHRGNLHDWSAYKHAVNANKKRISVSLTNLSIFRYPLSDDLILLNYTQNYQSDSFNSIREKEQYWKKHNGTWKIISERTL